MTEFCVCGCWQRSVHLHHVVYRQEVRRRHGDETDPRNLVGMAFNCHANHHSRAQVLRLEVLPDSVFDFARELFGSAAAFQWLGRYYGGSDVRLADLLQEEAA